ncbi:MAG: hypothetical protein ABTQ31_12480 [Rhizobiaceae bacterium]
MGSHAPRFPSGHVRPLDDPRLPAREALPRCAGLADARRMRDAIIIALALLGELDEIDCPDRPACRNMADLFEDVAGFALFGAEAARKAGGAGR